MKNSICNQIRILRVTKGYSQDYVALKLKISQGYYSKLESGFKPFSDYQLKKVTKIFGVKFHKRLERS